ncbi:sterol desaturase family protein [Sandarakinorhabdus sp.]|uniref:sterol desaturase family protein n=1 Tax=Sandarakinorhabdus sp. TaxID=1916663 RepID=UPI003341CD90
MIFRWFEPATVAGILLFWSALPPALADDPLVFLGVVMATRAIILALEFVHERHAGWRLNWQELRTDLFYLVLGTFVIQYANSNIIDAGLAAIKGALGITTPALAQAPLALQALLILFIAEFGQYWLHRAMHNWRPLWLLHAPHHHVTQLNTLKGGVGNPLELLLVFASLAALLDFSLPALFCAGHLLTTIACFAHANVRFNPPAWYAHVFTTIAPHSLHHSVGYQATRCNYANCLIILDRIFGTFRAGETDTVGQGDRRRLSIREQMLFPVLSALNGGNASPGIPAE